MNPFNEEQESKINKVFIVALFILAITLIVINITFYF